MSSLVSARLLVSASHPLPCAAVSVLATALAAASGRSPLGCGLVFGAVLSGQLSIGWSNDLVDLARDRSAARADKPLAVGALSPALVRWAVVAAVALCVPLSLASGWLAGLVHLVAVGGGWAYNLGLKRTAWSWAPYAVSFALLPAFVTLGLDPPVWPDPWVWVTGALLGVGAHFLNVVPDVEADLAAGVRGLPQRAGAVWSAAVGSVAVGTAAVVSVLGPAGPVGWWVWAGLGGTEVMSVGALAAAVGGRGGRTAPFRLAVGAAAGAVLLLVARGARLG